jgi:hypothetical protein
MAAERGVDLLVRGSACMARCGGGREPAMNSRQLRCPADDQTAVRQPYRAVMGPQARIWRKRSGTGSASGVGQQTGSNRPP